MLFLTPYLIIEGDEIVRACDRHWDETATLTKQVTKYKYMRKWTVEFLSKSQSLVIKIVRVNSISMTNLSIYFDVLRAVSRYDVNESTRFLMRPPIIPPSAPRWSAPWPTLRQYLSNWSQHVMVDSCQSKLVDVVSGVPRGSVLCPLLFLLYTSELFPFWKINWSVMLLILLWGLLCHPQALELQ